MRVYADTSFWMALWAGPQDRLNGEARKVAKRFNREEWLWTELHDVEVPCAAAAATHLQTAPLPVAVARAIVRRAEMAVNTGQVQRRALPVGGSVHQVGVLVASEGWQRRHTAFDTWHVAAAWSLGAGGFVTFDRGQAALARAAGLMAYGVAR